MCFQNLIVTTCEFAVFTFPFDRATGVEKDKW